MSKSSVGRLFQAGTLAPELVPKIWRTAWGVYVSSRRSLDGRKRPAPHVTRFRLGRADHSVRRALIGSILAARRAGMNPARAAKAESTRTAPPSVRGS